MKKTFFIAIFLLLTSSYCWTQYDTISSQQIAIKLKNMKETDFKDTVFCSVVGFFVQNNYQFSKVLDYSILVNANGSYFKVDLSNNSDSVIVSFVYFIPHNRLTEAQQNNPNLTWAPNEHLCVCSAKMGVAKINMSATGFTCTGAKPIWNVPENLNIDCHDTESKEVFFKKYYDIGKEFQNKLQTIPPKFIE